ncbi:MAG: bifunctional phosphoglucose/phosphomannose isomerase [bacterium]
MINQKYFDDITKFPSQLAIGVQQANEIKALRSFQKVILSGMGGSSLFVEYINQMNASLGFTERIDINRSYSIPKFADADTLLIASSYSGNTEESVSFLKEALERKLNCIVISAGGELVELAKTNKLPLIIIPQGVVPRLATGYFIGALVKFLTDNLFFKAALLEKILTVKFDVDQTAAKLFAEKLYKKVPIIYSSIENSATARIIKIKFNENSKVQAFWNEFPEQNHNELEGFTNLIINPYIILLKSKFTHPRISKRFDIYQEIFSKKGLVIETIPLKGKSMLEEMFNTVHFFDYVSFFLAELYNTNPESTNLLEGFKLELKNL